MTSSYFERKFDTILRKGKKITMEKIENLVVISNVKVL